jgi:hypothetical protein
VVGLPQFWQSSIIPAAAESTTNEVEQLAHAKMMSRLVSRFERVAAADGCIEPFISKRHTETAENIDSKQTENPSFECDTGTLTDRKTEPRCLVWSYGGFGCYPFKPL